MLFLIESHELITPPIPYPQNQKTAELKKLSSAGLGLLLDVFFYLPSKELLRCHAEKDVDFVVYVFSDCDLVNQMRNHWVLGFAAAIVEALDRVSISWLKKSRKSPGSAGKKIIKTTEAPGWVGSFSSVFISTRALHHGLFQALFVNQSSSNCQ